ncbi:MAG: plastocyanin/azurin family copper-binding protein [Gemmatimonadota bacterium]|nr:plastocyanin/azurin family copper-binding protein [Gemmatimonadota bacterium]
MRFIGRALLASAFVLGACGGDKTATTDTAKAVLPTPAATGASAAAMPATPGAAPTTGAMMPITGKTVEVKMVGDAQGYRFEPAAITIKQGDGIKFTVVSMPPHNIAFDPATVPAAGKNQLMANMKDQMQPLSSPFLLNPNDSYTISFAGVAPGTYPFNCTPHLAMGMKGTITVQ